MQRHWNSGRNCFDIFFTIWGDVREAIDNTNVTDNTAEEEQYNANDYSKETAEEMR